MISVKYVEAKTLEKPLQGQVMDFLEEIAKASSKKRKKKWGKITKNLKGEGP
jgi:hypothetical protein